jgi:WD40 repeat protein
MFKRVDFLHELPGGDTTAFNKAIFSADNRTILVTTTDNAARLWDVQTGQKIRDIDGGSGPFADGDFSPDGRYVLATDQNPVRARLWDIQTGQVIQQFNDHVGDVFRVAISSDNRYILTGNFGDDRMLLRDIQTGKVVREFMVKAPVSVVTFAPDNQQIASSAVDGVVRIWDVNTGQEKRALVGHNGVVWTLQFSPDGRYLSSGGVDGSVRIWDVTSGQEIRRLVGGRQSVVHQAVFSPDGKSILTGGSDGVVRLWDVDYHDTTAYLCSRLKRDFYDDERAQYGITDTKPTCPQFAAAPETTPAS